MTKLTIKDVKQVLSQMSDLADPRLIELKADPRKGVQLAIQSTRKPPAKAGQSPR